MARGPSGETGAVVANRVAVDHKHACAVVPIPREAMAALSAKDLVPSLGRVIVLPVLQVR